MSYHSIPGGPKSNRIINLKDDRGKTIDETAAFINQFFCRRIGPKLARSFDKEWTYSGPTIDRTLNLHYIYS